jgi:SAM-dependent methyltransferase
MNETSHVPRSWLIDRPLTGFALPQGRLARLFGWLLGLNADEQRDVYAAANGRADQRVLEVGHGPGILLEMYARAGAQVCGVDPSEPMVQMARRRLAKAGVDPASIRVGTAERTGFSDDGFDLVVSVNNMPMWSDLAAGLAELHRVLVPGGRLVVAWHGGRRPAWFVRNLVLPDDVLDRILSGVRERFGNGERETLERVEVFTALKQ